MSLYEALSRIAEQVARQRNLMNNEEATLQVSIRPFIEALGYDFRNLSEVTPQYTADPRQSGTERVDYAILREHRPIILIEAKAANVSLTENIWRQLHNYFNAEEVRFGLLTNGLEYHFYTDLKKRNIMDKQPYMTVDMLNLDKRNVPELEGLTKSGFNADRIIAGAQRLLIRRLLQDEMNSPSDSLVKHFAEQVHSGRLSASDVKRYRSPVKEAWRELIEYEIANRLRHREFQPLPDPEPTAPALPITDPALPKPQTWLDGSVQIPIYASWQDHEFEATLRLYKKIANVGRIVLWDGKWLLPKRAGEEARKSVVPDTEGYVNGMTFWHFRDPSDGTLRPIIDLTHAWYNDWDLIERVIIDSK